MQRARAKQNTFGAQPWRASWAPGVSLAGLFALYPSLGDVTLAADITTTRDGPVQVARFGALTVNTARTATVRNRGLLVLCDSLNMGAAGALSMTGRGAAGGPQWANQDILIPPSMAFTGRRASQADLYAWLAATGYFIGDPTLWACPPQGMPDVTVDYAAWPTKPKASSTTSAAMVASGSFSITVQTGLTLAAGNRATVYNSADTTKWMAGVVASYNSGTGALVVTVSSYSGTGTYATWAVVPAAIVSAAGCGLGSDGGSLISGQYGAGAAGGAGTNGGTGGGAQGGTSCIANSLAVSRTFPGKVWGGAAAGAGMYSGATGTSYPPDPYGGRGGDSKANNSSGGGAGNPGGSLAGSSSANGGDGTGGILIIICRGNVTLVSGHVISANGVAGGIGYCGGGGSGGGSVLLAYGGTLTGTPNLTATGGLGGVGTYSGGAGGVGSTQLRTFTEMGW